MAALHRPILFFLFSSLILSFPAVVIPATFTFVNQCEYTVWPGIQSNHGNLSTTGFPLKSGVSFPVSVPAPWSGRMWGRTYCSKNSTSGIFICLTGDCGSGAVECRGGGASPPTTLAEFALNGSGGLNNYSVSLVKGYNLPMIVAPQGGAAGREANCGIAGCVADLNTACPAELKVFYAVSSSDMGGDVGGDDGGDIGGGDIGEGFMACQNACEAFGDPTYCGEPSTYSELFKNACPLASTYALDGTTATFSCAAVDYVVTFCPTRPISEESGASAPSVSNGGELTHEPLHLSFTLITFLGALTCVLAVSMIGPARPGRYEF